MGPLLKEGDDELGGKPAWFEATYTSLAEQGLRVLALAYKRCGGERSAAEEVGGYAKKPREWVESRLTFGGFIAFGCPVRKDSASVIRSLRESRHTTIMLTGDAPLTALHVAKQVGRAWLDSVAGLDWMAQLDLAGLNLTGLDGTGLNWAVLDWAGRTGHGHDMNTNMNMNMN